MCPVQGLTLDSSLGNGLQGGSGHIIRSATEPGQPEVGRDQSLLVRPGAEPELSRSRTALRTGRVADAALPPTRQGASPHRPRIASTVSASARCRRADTPRPWWRTRLRDRRCRVRAQNAPRSRDPRRRRRARLRARSGSKRRPPKYPTPRRSVAPATAASVTKQSGLHTG